MAESDDLATTLLHFATKADTLRASGLSGLEGITRARQTVLKREHDRVSKKVGADHPRARALAARIETGATRLVDLRTEIARAGQEIRQTSATEWLLYGFVWQKDLSPAPDLTVALVDARGKWLEALGSALTDARGHFELLVTGPEVEPRSEAESAAAYIRLTDRDQRQLFRSEEPVAVALGEVLYREIVLEDRTAARVPPDEDIPRDRGDKQEGLKPRPKHKKP